MNKLWHAGAMAAILAAAAIGMNWWSAQAQTNLGPIQTTVSVPNTVVLNAVPANPSRRGLIICNSNATAANIITVGFGSNSPTDGVGLIIPGGQVAASCVSITQPVNGGGMGAQLNMIGHVAGPTSVVVLEF